MPPPSRANSLWGPFLARRFVRSTRRSESRPVIFAYRLLAHVRGLLVNPSVLHRKLGGSPPCSPLACRKEQSSTWRVGGGGDQRMHSGNRAFILCIRRS